MRDAWALAAEPSKGIGSIRFEESTACVETQLGVLGQGLSGIARIAKASRMARLACISRGSQQNDPLLRQANLDRRVDLDHVTVELQGR